MRRVVLSLGVLACTATVGGAQGTVSTQGFGYPSGGISTRAAASGAGFAEFDYQTTRNPSSLLGWGRGGIYLQYEPEFRSVTAGGRAETTTTARFPLFMASMQAGPRTMVALSANTFLDRTWATRVRSGQILGPDSVTFEELVASEGALNDLRLAGARTITDNFSLGIGLHVYTGENRLRISRVFDDSLKFGAIDRRLTLGFSGKAISGGATWRPHRWLALAASAKAGGNLEMHLGDTLLATAKVPNRYGFSVRLDAIPGASLGFSADHTQWSSLSGLGSASLKAEDGWDYGAGAEMTGPRMGPVPMMFYLGYRKRDLPFSLGTGNASEQLVSLGGSLPFAGPRGVLDIGVQRASRGSLQGVKEGAYIVSMGLTIRP